MSESRGVNRFIEYIASPEYQDHQLLSTDRSILSSRSVEIIPRESSTFGYQVANGDVSTDTLNDRMTFNLSDPRHYVDLRNSYFQCEFQCRAVQSDANNNVRLNAFLDKGGIHSLIKNIIIRHGSAEIHRIENYNKLYNIMNLAGHSKDYRNHVLGDSADSWEDQYQDGNFKGYQITYVQAEATYDATGNGNGEGRLLLANGAGNANADNELKIGDLLRVVHGDVGGVDYVVRECRVNRIAAANEIFVDGLGNADLAAGDVRQIILLKRGGESARKKVVQGYRGLATANLETHRLTWNLPVGFMKLDQYFPLPFLNQNIEIVLEFVEPALGIVVPSIDDGVNGPATQGDTTNRLGYKLSRARFVARMVEPSAEVFEAHRKLWKEDGLVYRMMDHRSYEQQLAAGSTQYNLTYQTNIKSVQSVLAVSLNQANQSASGNRANTQDAYSQSDFLKDDMADFRFRVGGLSFPDYGVVNINDVASGQAWRQLQLALGVMQNKLHGSSIESWEWSKQDSDKFIVGMLFAKENGSYNSGADISGNYLELELNCNTALAAARTLFTFINYDQAIVISEREGVRVYW